MKNPSCKAEAKLSPGRNVGVNVSFRTQKEKYVNENVPWGSLSLHTLLSHKSNKNMLYGTPNEYFTILKEKKNGKKKVIIVHSLFIFYACGLIVDQTY